MFALHVVVMLLNKQDTCFAWLRSVCGVVPFKHLTPWTTLLVLCGVLQAHDALHCRCPNLRKAGRVLELLQLRLADIVGAWERGALGADGFTLQEVEGLVCALFEDTDYRAECLQRIEAAADGA